MPIYEYKCADCGRVHEAIQKFSDAPLTVCPGCGGSMSKLISSTSFVLKGGGWYSDGYATPSGAPASGESSTAKADSPKPEPAKSETSKPADPKSDKTAKDKTPAAA